MRLFSRLRATISLLLPLLGLLLSAPASAQEMKQMLITDKQVTAFIEAQSDFAPLVVKVSEAADEPSAELKAELNDVAKKHGFESFSEYMDVNDNIAYVMGGLNSKTMEFTEPIERKKAEIASTRVDKSIPESEKKLVIEDLEKDISKMQPLKFKENIEVVKRHFAELVKLLPDEGSDEGLEDGEPDGSDEGAVEGPADGEPGEPVDQAKPADQTKP